MFHRGDRVRLTEKTAIVFSRAGHARLDWTKRQGSVHTVGEYSHIVTVKWDDRRTYDQWPEKALEYIPSKLD